MLSNIQCYIDKAEDYLLPEDTHHPSLLISLEYHQPKVKVISNSKSSQKRWNFRRADFPNLYRHLDEISWSFLENVKDVNTACCLFYNKLNSILDLYVPKSQHYCNNSFPPWFTCSIIRKIKRKWRLWRKYKSHKNQLNLQHFKTIRNELKHDIKIAYQLYTQNLEATIKTDPRKFWAHISRLKMRSGIPSEMIYLDNILRNPKDIVNAFMEHFHSSYSDFSPSSIDEFIDESSNNSINFISVTESNVFETLMTIKPNMTSGHDNIPGFLLHDCASVFSYPLSVIFNIILKTASFPDV